MRTILNSTLEIHFFGWDNFHFSSKILGTFGVKIFLQNFLSEARTGLCLSQSLSTVFNVFWHILHLLVMSPLKVGKAESTMITLDYPVAAFRNHNDQSLWYMLSFLRTSWPIFRFAEKTTKLYFFPSWLFQKSLILTGIVICRHL